VISTRGTKGIEDLKTRTKRKRFFQEGLLEREKKKKVRCKDSQADLSGKGGGQKMGGENDGCTEKGGGTRIKPPPPMPSTSIKKGDGGGLSGNFQPHAISEKGFSALKIGLGRIHKSFIS